jgi:hypothetical protein
MPTANRRPPSQECIEARIVLRDVQLRAPRCLDRFEYCASARAAIRMVAVARSTFPQVTAPCAKSANTAIGALPAARERFTTGEEI